MKRTVIFILLVLTTVHVIAQRMMPAVDIFDLEILRNNEEVTVKFNLGVHNNSVKSGYHLVIEPIIMGNTSVSRLPSVVVQGKKAKISGKRHLLAVGLREDGFKYHMSAGEAIAYEATIPYSDWMKGGILSLHGVSINCCTAMKVTLGDLATNLFSEVEVAKTAPVTKSATTVAEQLADRFKFLAPMSEYSQQIPEDRENMITVHFRQGRTDLELDYNNNRKSLIELLSVIRTINQSKDSRVSKIVIAGFASPEGTYLQNEQMAGNMVNALKQFIMQNALILDREIYAYNGAIDWQGLRKLVSESDLFEKQQILNIIDTQQEMGRMNAIMKLYNGQPYRHMLENHFPLVRNITYIKVYYENL